MLESRYNTLKEMGLFPKILSNEVLILYRSTDQDPEGLSAILAKVAQAAIKNLASGGINELMDAYQAAVRTNEGMRDVFLFGLATSILLPGFTAPWVAVSHKN